MSRIINDHEILLLDGEDNDKKTIIDMRAYRPEITVECEVLSPNLVTSPQLLDLQQVNEIVRECYESRSFTLPALIPWRGSFDELLSNIWHEYEDIIEARFKDDIKIWWKNSDFGFFAIVDDETLTTAVLSNTCSMSSVLIFLQIAPLPLTTIDSSIKLKLNETNCDVIMRKAVNVANQFLSSVTCQQILNEHMNVDILKIHHRINNIVVRFAQEKVDSKSHNTPTLESKDVLSGMAHNIAWTFRSPNENTIYINDKFEKRLLRLESENDEYKTIIVGLGMFIVHECSNLFMRYSLLPKQNTPAKLDREAGNFIEKMLFRGPVCVIIDSKTWEEDSAVESLSIEVSDIDDGNSSETKTKLPTFRHILLSYIKELYDVSVNNRQNKHFRLYPIIASTDVTILEDNQKVLKTFKGRQYGSPLKTGFGLYPLSTSKHRALFHRREHDQNVTHLTTKSNS